VLITFITLYFKQLQKLWPILEMKSRIIVTGISTVLLCSGWLCCGVPVVLLCMFDLSQRPNMKAETSFHRSWRNMVVYATARPLGNILSVGLLCCSKSIQAALHFALHVEI